MEPVINILWQVFQVLSIHKIWIYMLRLFTLMSRARFSFSDKLCERQFFRVLWCCLLFYLIHLSFWLILQCMVTYLPWVSSKVLIPTFFWWQDVYVQITNIFGSTKDPPIIVQASVLSDIGGLLPQRLKQLAQIITGSPSKNLGLDNAIFGKVKSISLSSFFKDTLSATAPTPSPAPSPGTNYYAEPSSSPSLAPSANSPSFSPDIDVSSPAPSMVVANPPNSCSYSGSKFPPSSSPNSLSNPTIPPAFTPNAANPYSSPRSWKFFMSPNASPLPDMPYASSPDERKGNTEDLLSPSVASSPSCKLLLSPCICIAFFSSWHDVQNLHLLFGF